MRGGDGVGRRLVTDQAGAAGIHAKAHRRRGELNGYDGGARRVKKSVPHLRMLHSSPRRSSGSGSARFGAGGFRTKWSTPLEGASRSAPTAHRAAAVPRFASPLRGASRGSPPCAGPPVLRQGSALRRPTNEEPLQRTRSGSIPRKSPLGRAVAAWARRRRSAAGAPGRAASWVVVSLEASGNSRLLKRRICDIMSIGAARSPGSRHYAENAGLVQIVGASTGILFIVTYSAYRRRGLLRSICSSLIQR